ncbi:MAG: S1 RNA-binding domain-containing protein [Ilumatobacteraceae bacterium]
MPHHVVVDGSNIATEGRQMPSLAQLNEAVMAFMEEHPSALITVVVDATFGHRIDAKESKEFDEAVANNELVAPPAGAVGRGDAFVLSIANKVSATILSNDSFQEFHPQYDWLFEEGRLIGGKPVPHIGWVFVPRVPVRGQVSRTAMKDAKRKRGATGTGSTATVRTGSPEASLPMPIPKTPPPGVRRRGAAAPVPADAPVAERAPRTPRERAPRAERAEAPTGSAVNDFSTFLSFVEHHPVGTSVNAVVESYSSHGAYVRVGDVKAYVPLRLMSDPPPRSAREFMKIGDAVTLVVESFAPARRSIDLATAAVATALPVESPAPKKATAPRKARASKKAAVAVEPVVVAHVEADPAPKRRTRKAAAPAPTPEPVVAGPVVAPKQARASKKVATPAVAPAPAKPKRVAAKPIAAKTVAAKPIAAKPVATKPIAAKTVATKPIAAKPVAAKPVAAKPATRGRASKAAAAPELPMKPAAPVPQAKRTQAKKAAPAAAPPVNPAGAPAPAGRRRRSS